MLDQYTALEMLTPLEKFKKYVESTNVFERQAAGRLLCEAAESCDTKDEFSSAMMFVSRLSVDPEPSVRAELIEKVPGLVRKRVYFSKSFFDYQDCRQDIKSWTLDDDVLSKICYIISLVIEVIVEYN